MMPPLILVVEDDTLNYLLMDSLLTLRGYQVKRAENGQECLELALELKPALILMDMRLPGLDGWATTEQIKGDSQLSHIPVIAVSVPINHDDEQRALSAGCDAYVAKPFDIMQLHECVMQHLVEE